LLSFFISVQVVQFSRLRLNWVYSCEIKFFSGMELATSVSRTVRLAQCRFPTPFCHSAIRRMARLGKYYRGLQRRRGALTPANAVPLNSLKATAGDDSPLAGPPITSISIQAFYEATGSAISQVPVLASEGMEPGAAYLGSVRTDGLIQTHPSKTDQETASRMEI
jgi:hypothetical protein